MFSAHGNFRLPQIEEKVLEFWKKNSVFEKTLALRKGRKRFVFFEGPPTANGRPGLHHVLARSFKDIITRYKTMRGYFVGRKGGWDTHGLPVEIEVEKKLGLTSKKDIEKFGIAKFNARCRESVWEYKAEWEKLTERMGFWLDLQNPYITYTPEYIETLWWIIARIAKKGLLYKGHKVVPWCPRCGTALSSHELAQGYDTVTENSVYVKFKLKKGQKIANFITDHHTYIVAWTTTPWTLPGNVALAIGENIIYSVAEKDGEMLLVGEDSPLGRELRHIDRKIKGKDLIGLEYEPLFDIPALRNKNSYKIYAADFVTTEEGTGVVHTAVMYGEDDYELGSKVGLPQHHTVLESGRFTREVPGGLAGLSVKPKDKKEAEITEKKIFEYLKKRDFLFKIEPYTHEYPFCWRCDTPIIYYARDSWFVAVNKVRSRLISNNEKISWVPAHLKDGRFGQWLHERKDWNFSRERYWGTPLPVWECKKCGIHEVIGSIDELSVRAGGARNEYWIMRHGEALLSRREVVDLSSRENSLTHLGRIQVLKSASKLKKIGIELIITSPVLRTKETAMLIGKKLGVKIIVDKQIREINPGAEFEGRSWKLWRDRFPTYQSRFEGKIKGGESFRDVRKRMWEFLSDMERKYHGRKILIVSHEAPLWMLIHAAEAWSEERAIREKVLRKPVIDFAEVRKLNVKVAPRDPDGLVDLHRPYVDDITLRCRECGGRAVRVKEVVDVWFDSGAMPFAQWHYPFENKELIDKRREFPADYIAEAMDQTRGWFYTLLAVSTLLGYGAPYKNVISLGLVHDKFGQKMSKSRGNAVDPWQMIEKYGIDAVRWYFYTLNSPGEQKNFDEADIQKVFRRFHLLLYNSFVFYKTYAKQTLAGKGSVLNPRHILDKWILARLNETIILATRHLDRYEVREAALAIEGFVDDLSRWYIRRSRRRFQKPSSEKDFLMASTTLGHILQELSKLIAPFCPFFGEALYSGIRHHISSIKQVESVHLEGWPKSYISYRKFDVKHIISAMAEVRRIASAALAKRAEAGIKVRQPLAELRVRRQASGVKFDKDLVEILASEVNVKRVVFDPKIEHEIELDTIITSELKEEGILREFVRMVQDLRQRAGLKPKDRIILFLKIPQLLRIFMHKHEKELKAEVGAKSVEYKKSLKFDAEISTKLDEHEIWFAVKKVE